MYKKMGECHVRGDVRVSWNNVLDAQKDINGHLHTLNKVFQTGSNWHQKARDRMRAAKEVANLTIPLLYLLLKDHKPEDKDGLPKTRPVCGASTTLNQEMSE